MNTDPVLILGHRAFKKFVVNLLISQVFQLSLAT